MIYPQINAPSARRTLNMATRILLALQLDGPLLVGLGLVAIFGLIVLYSASGQNSDMILRTLLRMALGGAAMVALAQLRPNTLRTAAPWLYALGIVLLLVVDATGYIGKGAQRWLNLGIVRFQPSEIMKLAVPLLCAWYLQDRPLPLGLGSLAVVAALILLPVGLTAAQPDHIIQSQIAIGSGGVFGKGWMNGSQSQLEYLPERHTDFIFAVIGEEFGLLGMLVLVLLYLFVVGRALYLATQMQDTFARLLGASLALTFFVYVFINMGMVCGLLPVVGVPLPLVSYGGTSMVTLLAGFGILMSLYSHRKLVGS